ncbi:hypothetical protein ABBQ38_008419 [Trebouxia sp. C0009 RCD-2024]
MLQVTFAVKGSEFTALPWLVYEEIKRHGVDIFTDAAEVTLADSTDSILHSLQSGRVDAAILRSDVIAHSEKRGLLNTTSFKFVDAVITPGYPYPVSTTLLPADIFIAAATVPSHTKKTIAEALFRITKDDNPAQAASYSTWVPPDSYARMWSLLRNHGLMQSNGTCNPAADLYDIIICPPSTKKAPQDTMPSHCREQGIEAESAPLSLSGLPPSQELLPGFGLVWLCRASTLLCLQWSKQSALPVELCGQIFSRVPCTSAT